MIYFLTSENSFERSRRIQAIRDEFDGLIELVDPAAVEPKDLPDLLQATSLFSQKRLVIMKQLSENKAVWESLPDWLGRVSDDVTLILSEEKPDKRTRTYKELLKSANVEQFPAYTNKDEAKLRGWLLHEAEALGLILTSQQAAEIVRRVRFDQWQLRETIKKLALAPEVTMETIDRLIEPRLEENVFGLFETALRGDSTRVAEVIRTLRQTNDPYQTLGLLQSQTVQLAALALADKPAAEVAKDIGAHPFVLSKLSPVAARLGQTRLKQIVEIMAEADMRSKGTVQAEPWVIIEAALLKIARG